MAQRLTFTLAGRDELSRVLNGSADSADRLRLRLAGITADADGNLRDLHGRFLSLADAQRLVDDRTGQVRTSMTNLSDAAGKVGEALRASLISLAPAAIPAAAGLAGTAATLAGQLGAVALAAGAYGLALGAQISAMSEALQAQTKYDEAVRENGATSQEAIKAQVAYQQQLAKLPPETQRAAVAVGLLKTNYQAWSDSLAGDVMGPFNKGVAVANALLPETTGLVKGASSQFDRLMTLLGGAISTPGFDALNDRVTAFSERTLRRAIDKLTVFFAKADAGELDNSGLNRFFDYARDNGPLVWDTLEQVGDALLHVLEAGSGVGVGMLEVINALSGIVSAVPPGTIATLLQLAIAIKAVKLAAAGAAAGRAAMAALGVQIGAMTTAAAAAPGPLTRTTAAVGALSRTAKLAMAGTGLGLLLITLDALSSSSREPKADVDKLTTSLAVLGDTGKVSGEALKVYGADLGGLADALGTLARPSNLDSVQQFLTGLIGMDSTPVKNAKEDFESIDQALTNLVSQGKADLAAAALQNTIAALQKQGYTAKEVTDQLDDYKAALAGQALEQQLAAQAMGLFGDQAQRTQAQLDAQRQSADGLRQAIVALNDVNRQGLSGMIGFEAAIDAATKAAAENAGVLDMQGGKLVLNTEKQRAAATALNDLASKTDEAASSARESGAAWGDVNAIYERGRQQLIKSAMQMGLTRVEAERLAAQILKTPDKTAKLQGDMEDLKAKVDKAKREIKSIPPSKVSSMQGTIADLSRKVAAAKAQIKSVPPSKRAALNATIADLESKVAQAKAALASVKSRTVTLTAFVQYKGKSIAAVSAGRMATGGLVGRDGLPGYPGGGLIRGVGTPTSDSNLIWASRDEYMVKAASVKKYGVAFMDALNDGLLPASRTAARPGLPATAAPEPAAGGCGCSGVDVQVNFRDDRLRDLIDVTVTPKIRESEQRQAHRAKVGRR
ncbi:hypothetical protein [Streptomyces sp. NPDC002328]|uniref:hypothetical protein n=1 Tax=Streptomyces sp. NPDC002328 TaxID=3364642 RepID=UPI0036A83474